jgi:hypothetical protein
MLSLGRRRENVMGVFRFVGVLPFEDREPVEIVNPEFESEPTDHRVACLETSNLDSDDYWVGMMKREYRAAACPRSTWQLLQGAGKADSRCNEVAEANRKTFLELLRKSYAKRADTIIWSMIVFILATVVLIPFLGFLLGPVFAGLVSLCWSAVHRVRRL